jgi:outer membrane protein assembly factor BamE (lipoprotein component of BamABCDE complex)
MKNAQTYFLLAAALGTAWLAGCTTPESRINAQPQVFAQLTPAQQSLVKNGQVALGFSMDAVKLALGDPDHITVRTDASGQAQIWHYVTYETAEGVILYGGYYHRHGYGWGGWWGGDYPYGYPYYLDYPDRRVHERFLIVFKDSKVVSIEQDVP